MDFLNKRKQKEIRKISCTEEYKITKRPTTFTHVSKQIWKTSVVVITTNTFIPRLAAFLSSLFSTNTLLTVYTDYQNQTNKPSTT